MSKVRAGAGEQWRSVLGSTAVVVLWIGHSWPSGGVAGRARQRIWPGDGPSDGLRVQTEAIALCRDDKPVGLVVKPQRGGRCLANRTSARRAAARTFPVMVIPIVTELPLALEPTTRDDFLGSQAAPRPTPVSRVAAAGSRA